MRRATLHPRPVCYQRGVRPACTQGPCTGRSLPGRHIRQRGTPRWVSQVGIPGWIFLSFLSFLLVLACFHLRARSWPTVKRVFGRWPVSGRDTRRPSRGGQDTLAGWLAGEGYWPEECRMRSCVYNPGVCLPASLGWYTVYMPPCVYEASGSLLRVSGLLLWASRKAQREGCSREQPSASLSGP